MQKPLWSWSGKSDLLSVYTTLKWEAFNFNDWMEGGGVCADGTREGKTGTGEVKERVSVMKGDGQNT